MKFGNSNQLIVVKVVSILSLAFTLLTLFISPSIIVGKMLSTITLGLVVYPLLKSLKTGDYHLTVLFFFMLSYVLVPLNYYWLDLHINMYQECEGESTVYKVLQILCVFHSVLLYNIKFSKQRYIGKPFKERSNTIYCILILLSLLFVTFGSSGKTILETGSYAESIHVKQSSTIYAYSIITISLAYVYSDTLSKRYLTYFVVAYFCFKDLLMGGRVDSLELLLTIFFIRLQYIWSRKTIIIMAVSGALFFLAWGAFRSDVNMGFFKALVESIPGIGESGNRLSFQTGTSAEVYYSSLRVIYMIEHGVLDFGLRIQSLLYFFISAIVPYSMLPDIANLSSYMQTTYWSGGGGLGPVFFYAFGGWLGVFLFSLFISYSMNLFQKRASKYVHYYAILMLATTPRWYAYYPVQLIKLCLIGMVLYIILNIFFNSSRNTIAVPPKQ